MIRLDPLSIHRSCHECDATAWVRDSVYLDEDHLLCDYPPACRHMDGSVEIVNVGEREMDTRCMATASTTNRRCRHTAGENGLCRFHAAAPIREAIPDDFRCTATATSTGQRCRNEAEENGLCSYHAPQLEPQRSLWDRS